MIFGYQYTKVQNFEYVPLGLEYKHYVLHLSAYWVITEMCQLPIYITLWFK